MNDIKDIFANLRQDLELTSEERSLMRSELERLTNAPATVMVAVPSPFAFLFDPPKAFAFALLVLIIGGGSTSLAATGSLPGDTLYGVKLGVNERLERALAVSSEAKADVEVRHAQERLQEVELLAAKGSVDEVTLDIAEAKLEEHVARADEAAKDLVEEGNEGAADAIHAKIATALTAHADIIRSQSDDADGDARKDLRGLAIAVKNAAGHVEDAQEDDVAESDENVEALALAREASVQEAMDELSSELAEDGIAAETQEEFSLELAAIQAEFEEAVILEDKGDASEAYKALGERAYRALALLSSAKRIEKDADKEVLVTLEGEEEATTTEAEASTTAPVLMMTMQAKMAAPVVNEPEPQPRKEFRFWVRERSQED